MVWRHHSSQKLADPDRRVVIPEPLERFLEQIGPDDLQVAAEEIAQQEVLLGAEILTAPEQQPTGLF